MRHLHIGIHHKNHFNGFGFSPLLLNHIRKDAEIKGGELLGANKQVGIITPHLNGGRLKKHHPLETGEDLLNKDPNKLANALAKMSFEKKKRNNIRFT
jgi:hypothetical protein